MRVALELEYNGRRFSGSQYQEGVATVQGELESALAVLLRCASLRVVLSGRTDSGVHARAQVAHFDWPDAPVTGLLNAAGQPDLWRLCWGLNGILAGDLSISRAQMVPPQFHARFSAVSRTYVYRILNRPQRSALRHGTHHFVPFPLDVPVMQECCPGLVGIHDFSSFKSSNSDRVSSLCHVQRAELLNLGEGELEFWISANHFVYNMVRIIVGTLVEIGLGKRPPTRLQEALSRKDRELAGPTAPPWGLTLHSVEYPEEFQLFKRQNDRIPVRKALPDRAQAEQ